MTGVLTLNQSLAGFGDPATVFVTSLFVASAALEKTGITAWAGQALMRGAGDSRWRLIVLMMLFVGVLSALISVNGAVAALLPVVVVLAVRLKRPPSRLLMPLVFGAHAGSMLALTGTPVNVLVLEASLDAGRSGFGYFEFALVGLPLVVGTVLIAVLLGERLLPLRESRALPPDLSLHARTLVEQFRLGTGVFHLRVRAGSRLVGTPRGALDVSDSGLALVTVRDPTAGCGSGTSRRTTWCWSGAIPRRLRRWRSTSTWRCATRPTPGRSRTMLFNRASGLAEVLIPPRSPLIGDRLFPGMVTPSGDLVVLAVHRQGADLGRGMPLAAGDTLLLQGTWAGLDRRLAPAEVLVVELAGAGPPAGAADGTGGAGRRCWCSPPWSCCWRPGSSPPPSPGCSPPGRCCCWVLVGRRDLPGDQLDDGDPRRGDDAASTAITETGAAKLLADGLISLVGGGAAVAARRLFVLTAVLGQVISNTATALIIIPISVVAAAEMGISPQPVLMCVAVAAAAAFLTPVATPTNLMVMEPAGYRFGDYWKFGLPMMLWFFVVAVGLVPVIWPF